MKVYVNTTHELSIGGDENGPRQLSAKVDSDNTTMLTLPTYSVETIKTGWLTRDELSALQTLLSRTIKIIDATH